MTRLPEGLPVAQPTCPGCGEQIFRTHRCRASAVAKHPMPKDFVDEVHKEIEEARAAALLVPLPLDKPDPQPCTGCGTTERLIVHHELGLCRRCLVAAESSTTR